MRPISNMTFYVVSMVIIHEDICKNAKNVLQMTLKNAFSSIHYFQFEIEQKFISKGLINI